MTEPCQKAIKTRMLSKLAQSPSKKVLVLTVTFLVGTVLHAVFEFPWPGNGYFLPFGCFLLPASLAFRRGTPGRLSCLIAAVLLLSSWRYESALAGLPPPVEWPKSSVRFQGVLVQPARQTIRGTVLTFGNVRRFSESVWEGVDGRFRVWIRPPETVPFGPDLEWSCRVWPPDVGMPFSYYLERVVGECSLRGPPAVVGGEGVSVGPMGRFRDYLRRVAAGLWPEPESSFMLGLLLGDRDGIPAEMTEDFRETGTSHILAVSGYNISRVVGLAMMLAAAVRLRRRRAALLSGAAVIGFSVLVGGQASVIRAALMGGIGLLAILWSRQSGGGNALWLTAAVMLAVSPLALKHDLGFQLSFAAVWGLGAFGPGLSERFVFVPEAFGLRQSAAETLAATLATVPIILFSFGRLPLVGPLVNLVILPFIPWSMMLGAVSVGLGSVSRWLALPFSWFGFVLLRIVEAVVRWSAGLGFWAIEADIGPAVAVVLAVCLVVWGWGWNRAGTDRRRSSSPHEFSGPPKSPAPP
ncbi:ComEC/Rec2 family competence protein [Candidatus Uhrbacteria bacterium]|nr:ComEC/Rec2 family competence protein [Candidatus Uhrbacteria bacterium]